MNKDEQKLYSFYETSFFTRRLDALASLEMLYAIQADLLADPERWPIVKGTNGARKGRVADPAGQEGKSGGFRYLYFYLEHRGQIYLLYLFAKSSQANLTAAQKKEIAKLVAKLKQELK